MSDLVGKRIGKLLVLSKTTVKKYTKKGTWNISAYVCLCDCGNKKTLRRDYLISGRAKSCGCYRAEAAANATRTHGKSKGSKNHHPLYDVWSSMIQRCHNKNVKGYGLYGGRGITVCDKWLKDFENFYKWSMANGYRKGLSIDRINNNEGYSPENCRWTTSYEQSRNKRTNITIEFQGKRQCLQDVADSLGVNRSTLNYRYKHGLPLVN